MPHQYQQFSGRHVELLLLERPASDHPNNSSSYRQRQILTNVDGMPKQEWAEWVTLLRPFLRR